jgi:hypothetical protein
MSIIPNNTELNNSISEICQPFLARFKVNELLRKCGIVKKCGFNACQIFSFLAGMVFTGMNLYSLGERQAEKVPFGKDAAYRFLNRLSANWEILVALLAFRVVAEVDRLTSDKRRSVLIIDDSPYYRNRSKNVELLSRCYDHVENKYYKGFTLLSMGWSDGQTFLPVSFRLLASGNDKNLLCGPSVKEDNRTIATRRRADARTEKPSLVLKMLEAVKGTPAEAKYVLFDSWFSSPSSILGVKSLGFDVVARLKNHENFLYMHDGKLMSIKSIYNGSKKRRGRSRYLLSADVKVRHKDYDGMVAAKIVYVRDRNNRKKWIAIISTDVALTEDEIVSLYAKRWDTEPFFKMCKQYFRLANEFQSRSFDAIVAHTAIVFTRYMIVSLANRESRDDRTVCDIFYAMCKELEDITFEYAFWLIISTLAQSAGEYLHLAGKQISGFIRQFMRQLPAYIADKLTFSMCES